MSATLLRKNVSVHGHRTSLRLEREMWEALDDICRLEDLNIHQLCTVIERQRAGLNRTSALRAFIVRYFREAATREGHVRAGHGQLIEHTTPAPRLNPSVGPLYAAAPK